MKPFLIFFFLASFVTGDVAAQWKRVAPGVDYREYSPSPPFTYRVARVDLTQPSLKVVGSRPSDRGLTVSEFADRHDAVVAINGDYFDEKLKPIGATLGACGKWSEQSKASQRREALVAFGRARAEIIEPAKARSPVPRWVEHGVSGWPMLVRNCKALSSKELPGSDRFTRAPHPRTAVGFSADRRTLYLVVVDGKKEQSAGVTLSQLAAFMRNTLEVCSAVNLDGGGSTAMAVTERLVSKPIYGQERPVANHLAVVDVRSYLSCDATEQPATTVVKTPALWNDLDEVFGNEGKRKGQSYQQRWYRSGVSAVAATESSFLAYRDGTENVAVGVLTLRKEELAATKAELVPFGLTVLSITPFPTLAPDLRHLVFTKRGALTDTAHTIQKVMTRLKATASDSSEWRGTTPPSELDSMSGRKGEVRGNRWTLPITRNGKPRPWQSFKELDALSSLSVQPSDNGPVVFGALVVASGEVESLTRSLRNDDFDVQSVSLPLDENREATIVYFASSSAARSLRRAIALLGL